MDMNTETTQQYTTENMTVRLDNGRLFHLWVIGITPLNSRKLDTGVKPEIQ